MLPETRFAKGKFSVTGWTGERSYASADGSQASWSYGKFTTTAGSILWPFQINSHSSGHDATTLPTEFEIMQLDANHLKLIYPQKGTGSLDRGNMVGLQERLRSRDGPYRLCNEVMDMGYHMAC